MPLPWRTKSSHNLSAAVVISESYPSYQKTFRIQQRQEGIAFLPPCIANNKTIVPMTRYLLFALMLGLSTSSYAQATLFWQDSGGDNSLDAGDWTSADWNTQNNGTGIAVAPSDGDILRFQGKTVTINSWPLADIELHLRSNVDMTIATDMTVDIFRINANNTNPRSLTVNSGVTLTATSNFTSNAAAVIDITIDGTISASANYINGNGDNTHTIINSTGSLSVGGNMRVNGELTNSGMLEVTVDINESTGIITNNASGTIALMANIQNWAGTFVNNGTINAQHFDVNAGASLTNNSGADIILSGAMRDISGSVNNAGSISTNGRVVVNGSFTNTNELSVGGDLRIDAGTFTNTASGNVEVSNCGDITVAFGAAYINDGNTGTTMGGTECHAAVPCEGDCTGLNSILPVELLSFTGQPKEDRNSLQWVTASEENTKEHLVERSTDGRLWSNVGNLAGAGYSTTPTTYSFEDFAPPNSAYYRIRFVDYDGYEEFSPVLLIDRDGEGQGDVTIAPNPCQDQLRLQWQSAKSDRYSVSIFSLQGQLLAEEVIDLDGVSGLEYLSVSQLRAGTYLLRVTDEFGNLIFANRLLKL